MKLEVDQTSRVRAFPVQIIEVDGGVVVRRGCAQVKFSGDGAHAIVSQLFEGASRPDGVDEDALVASFAGPFRSSVSALIKELRARRLLVDAKDPAGPQSPEGPLEVFYWHFGSTVSLTTEGLAKTKLVIMGVGEISRQLARALRASGIESFDVVDHPQLRNLHFFEDDGTIVSQAWGADLPMPATFESWSERDEELGCLVATSDFGGTQTMRQWNEFAVESKCHFLPVVLQDLIGYIGPLVVPGETACYECLRARQNSHFDDPPMQRLVEGTAFEGQAVAGHHPSMTSVLGDLAALELTKFYGRTFPNPRVGTLIQVNLMTTEIVARKVLKVPRCRVCSPLIPRGSTSPDKTIFMPGHPVTR